MPKYSISDLRALPGIDTIGDAVLYGEGRVRAQIGTSSDGSVALTPAGVEIVEALLPKATPAQSPNNFNELALYTLNTFGVKLDQRKSLKTLKEQVAKLEQARSPTVSDAWGAS